VLKPPAIMVLKLPAKKKYMKPNKALLPNPLQCG
jgi:hypothetical protein